MPVSILMPALSPTMTEGKLAKWLKAEGDQVSSGDVLAEIETDKATMEVEAVDEGVLAKIIIPEGTDAVAVNAQIAILLEEDEDDSALDGFTGETPVVAPTKVEEATPDISAAPTPKTTSAAPTAPTIGARIFATPLARRIAADKGLDLATVKGSGPNGRIIKADVESASVAPASQVGVNTQRATSSGPDAKALADMLGMAYEAETHSKMRTVIADRLLESKQTIPHFYLTVECRLDALMAARKQLNEAANGAYKLSVNDFVIKASAYALNAYPDANVAWTDSALLRFKHADISVAVATPTGLITPIVKAAETKGLRQISEEVKDLAGRAREGRLKPEEFQGGTFSISNLGMFGISEFSAIINPPQACILAVGAGEQKPYVENGEVKIGTFMRCTLSVDHRAVDGAVGAEYLQHFKRAIENPVAMIV